MVDLGSVISSDGSLDKEISAQVCKDSQALGHLKTRVLSQHNIGWSTKVKVYRAVILTSFLYGCETWTQYRRHLKQLERFHTHSLRTILNIKRQDCVSNLQVLDMVEPTSTEVMILKNWLHWVGHVIPMVDNRLPKQLMFGELASGKRKQGRPLKRLKDCIKASLYKPYRNYPQGACAPRSWQDWMASPHQTHQDTYEERHRTQIETAWERRKASADAPGNPGLFPYPHCPLTCKSRIRLHSHLCAHSRREQRWRASSLISMDYYHIWVYSP